MRAAVLTAPRKMEIQEREKPVSKNGSVIVKVLATAICGADNHYYESGDQVDMIRGHEMMGIVDDPGSREDLHPGDKVWVAPGDPCGKCIYCKSGAVNLCEGAKRGIGIEPGRPGSFAEYVSTRPDHVIPLPDGISDLEAAVLEPCVVAYHCFAKIQADPEKPLLLIGAGPIGVLTALWAKQAGVKKVIMTDTNDNRLAFAKKMGVADVIYNATSPTYLDDLRIASGGDGFDQCADCVAFSATINSAFKAAKGCGRIVVVGYPRRPLSVDVMSLVDKEIEMVGSYGWNFDDAMAVVDAIASKKVNVEQIVTSVISLEELPAKFEQLISKDNTDMKVVIRP